MNFCSLYREKFRRASQIFCRTCDYDNAYWFSNILENIAKIAAFSSSSYKVKLEYCNHFQLKFAHIIKCVIYYTELKLN